MVYTTSVISIAEGADKLESIEGNEFRDIWKASCWQMLDEVIYHLLYGNNDRHPLVQSTYDVYEKAVFAVLSGNVGKVCASISLE